MNPEELLTPNEVADRYKIGTQTQRRYREEDGLPYIRLANRIYYDKAVFDLWIKQFAVNEVAEESR